MSLDLHKSHITDSRLSSYINIISDRNEKKAICFYTKILGRVEHSQIVSVSAMVEGSTRPSD